MYQKIRWVIESYHARVKKWYLLGEMVQNSFIPNNCVRTISAALNRFRNPLIFNATNDRCDKVVRTMENRITHRNIIFGKAQNGELPTQSRWKKIEVIDFEFPKMSLDELRLLFFRTYQVKYARTYAKEHFNIDSDFIVEIENSIDDIERSGIQSRHSNVNRYKQWIQYSLTGDLIRASYCQCSLVSPLCPSHRFYLFCWVAKN